MKTVNRSPFHHRVSQTKKEENDFAWYKHHIDLLDTKSFGNYSGFGGVDDTRRMQANYDLFNNKINKEEFEYVCKPHGDGQGELPATFVNRDIISGKIKVLLGMEIKRPFSWKIVAVNEEATTRKEQEEFGRIKEYVIGEIMQPIIAQIQQQEMEKQQGRQLSPEEQQRIQQQVQQQIKSATPEEVKKYMQRKHQDPAEALGHQLLEYIIYRKNLPDVFNDGWKHGCISGIEVYWEGETNAGPDVRAVNTLNFDYDKSPDVKYIEDGEWAVCVYQMTPSQIVSMFADELTDDEIDSIYSQTPFGSGDGMADATFEFSFNDSKSYNEGTLRVLHVNFKSLKKIGFLTSINPQTGELEESIQDEWYKFSEENGDISIDWQYIPESHEAYKIGADIYKRMRPVPGQYHDINNLYECKLSYKGAAYDNMNSEVTSLVDRMKTYQFYYNIIMYRIEMLMASDKGKILMLNMNSIPKSAGIDIKKLLYYMESIKVGFLNPSEEGNKNMTGNIGELAHVIDMSLLSQISQYVELAEYINTQCGNSVGITKQMEGQTAPQEAVRNAQMNYTQSSYIIEPYFELHNQIKRNVLEGVLKTTKSYYSGNNADKLSYVIDDLSTKMLKVDAGLLDNSTYGLFISNSSKAWDAKQAVQQLSQAAMQNQKAELSDIIKIIRSESVQEAEELLAVAEERAHEKQMEMNSMAEQMKAEQAEKAREFQREEWDHEAEMIVLKEKERRETEIQKQTIMSMGFNEDKDMDQDGMPDILEVAKFNTDANIKMRKQKLEEFKFSHQLEQDDIDNENAKEKLAIDRKKASKPASSK